MSQNILLCQPRSRLVHGRNAVVSVVHPPLPEPFDFGITHLRPLVPLRAVTMLLNKSTSQVMALIEGGELRWAFDISTQKARRREVRVLRQSLLEFAGLVVPSEDPELPQVINSILPAGVTMAQALATGRETELHDFQVKSRLPIPAFKALLFPAGPVLRGTELAHCFSCISQHIHNLLREKSLVPVNLRLGPKASPLIMRDSIVEFLGNRRIS